MENIVVTCDFSAFLNSVLTVCTLECNIGLLKYETMFPARLVKYDGTCSIGLFTHWLNPKIFRFFLFHIKLSIQTSHHRAIRLAKSFCHLAWIWVLTIYTIISGAWLFTHLISSYFPYSWIKNYHRLDELPLQSALSSPQRLISIIQFLIHALRKHRYWT